MTHIYTTIFSQLSAMKYFKNSFTSMSHESAVQDLLISNGFTECPVELTKADRDKIRKSDTDFNKPTSGNFYYFQPLGTQSPPDFVLISDGVVIFLECKSGAEDKITWNTSLPKRDYIYLFSCKRHDASTIFLGQHYIEDATKDIFKELALQNKKNNDAANRKLKELGANIHGFTYYERPMFQQAGGKVKTSVVGHANRTQYEGEVFEFIERKCAN